MTTTFFGPTSTVVPVVPNLKFGCTLSNDGVSPLTVLDVAIGTYTDITGSIYIPLTAPFTKSIAGPWLVGTGQPGMGAGVVASPNEWLHVFSIASTAGTDIYFDTSTTAANKPPGTTAEAYLGSFKLSAASQIIPFTQNGQQFLYNTPINDVVSFSTRTPTLVTLSTPLGLVTEPLIYGSSITVQSSCAIWSPAQGAGYPAGSYPLFIGGSTSIGQWVPMPPAFATNKSSQLYLEAFPGPISITTVGYINPHVSATS